MAEASHWFEKYRGLAVTIAASGNYIAGALWPPIVQHGIETVGWRHTYVLLGIVCGLGMLLLWRLEKSKALQNYLQNR